MEIAQIAQSCTDPCNTKEPGSVLPEDTTKLWRARNWSIVLNNYTEKEIAHFAQLSGCKAKIAKEVGESGTPHLQCYFEFPNPKGMSAIKKILGSDKVHCEPAYKCRAANLRYCTKGEVIRDDFPETFKYKGADLPTSDDLYEWQKEICSLIKEQADDRSIYWFYEPTGNSGKSKFGKFLCFHNPNVCLLTATKSADILTAVDEQYNTYILDFPRHMEQYFPYNAMEQLKNGFITDSKLKKKARIMMFDPPHVICFSNSPPDKSKLSRDRWRIFNISTNTWEE